MLDIGQVSSIRYRCWQGWVFAMAKSIFARSVEKTGNTIKYKQKLINIISMKI